MKLLITGAFNYSSKQISILKEQGWEVIFSEREDSPLHKNAYEVDAVVCNWLFVNHDIKLFKNLKYIQLLSAGLDRVPLDYIREKKIILNNARGVYSIPMAEFAICGVLQLYKHSYQFYEQKASKCWNKIRNLKELSEDNVLIIGTGSVGTEIAKRVQSLVKNVDGIDLFPKRMSCFQNVYHLNELNTCISNYDIVIIALPLTDETRGLFNKKLIFMMKKGTTLVNVSRGGIIDENALIDSLKTHLFGAVIDVFKEEPLPQTSELWNLENVVLTPHNSFVSDKNKKRMWQVIQNFLNEVTKND